MGSAAFLNETINQLAEAYLTKRQQERQESIPYEQRSKELQKVKMYIADRNIYGVDLNPTAVELAEVSLWLNTIYEGSFVPWFGTQLVNGNSLIGAHRACYSVEELQATTVGLRWYEQAPQYLKFRDRRKTKKQIYHFLTGDPGMASYADKVIKTMVPDALNKIKDWNKKFHQPYTDDEITTLRTLSQKIDQLWSQQVKLRKEIEAETTDHLDIYGHDDKATTSYRTVRRKDEIYRHYYKSEKMKNAGPYARLRFAMDYWCVLWFWPLDKADLLPTRSEFLAEMHFILEGTASIGGGDDPFMQGNLFRPEALHGSYANAQDEAQDVIAEKNLMQFLPHFTAVSYMGLKDEVYLNLRVMEAETTVPASDHEERSPWDDIIKKLSEWSDEKELAFLRKLQQADIPLPDVIGDELMDGDTVLDLVELGWTTLKKAFILKECQESCENVRKAGWQVFDETTEDVQAIFGGREE